MGYWERDNAELRGLEQELVRSWDKGLKEYSRKSWGLCSYFKVKRLDGRVEGTQRVYQRYNHVQHFNLCILPLTISHASIIILNSSSLR